MTETCLPMRRPLMIDRSSIFHRPTDQFAYPIDEHTLHLKLRSKKNNLLSVELIYGDQYDWKDNQWVTKQESLLKIGSDSLFDYWLITVQPPFKRLRYGFSLKNQDESVCYTEKGFYANPPEDPSCYFCFPYLHKNEISRAPSWVKDTVWYQIFPERFANGDQSINPKDTKAWESEPPRATNFFGGDFQGIIDHLDYLVQLGITGIYFTPIFKAYSNHKYDTIDYFEIDPQFGDKAIFKKMVEKCHDLGIKVMLDAVFNHSGYHFEPFQQVLQHGEASSYSSWFHTSVFPLKGGDRPNYATFGFVDTMPKLNTLHEEVMEYLLKVGRYWVEEFDIDGWRLDVANEIDHAFWREFRSAVKKIKPDLFILGEIWHDSMAWLRGDQFDSVMNYPFLTNVIQFFAKETITASQFVEDMTFCVQAYPSTINETLFNLVGSHDTPRIMTECGGNTEKVKLIFTFLMTFIGTPCIYYGDEIGLNGEMDPGCRACMPWEKNKWNQDLLQHVKFLIKLRKKEPLLRNEGTLTFLETSDSQKCIAYLKEKNSERVLIILNPTNQTQKYSLPFTLRGKRITNLLDGHEYATEAEKISITLNPFGYAICKW